MTYAPFLFVRDANDHIKALEAQNAALLEALQEYRKAIRKHTVLGRGDWLNDIEKKADEAIRKAQ